MKPKISVITICYNSREYIEETILSVLSQKYDSFEYIVIDGESTDGTMKVIERYSKRITKILSEPDKGISDAFNKGIKIANGDIIGIMNSGDIFKDENVLANVAEKYEKGIDVYRGSEIVKNYSTGYQYVLNPSEKYYKNPIRFHVCHMGCFICKSAYEKYGLYRDDFKYAMDMELLYRFNHCGATEKKINVVVGVFRTGGISQTHEKDKRIECEKILINLNRPRTDILLYHFSLILKDYIRKILDKYGNDTASKIRYGRNL